MQGFTTNTPPEGSAPPLTSVEMTPERMQSIGVRTGRVMYKNIQSDIRATEQRLQKELHNTKQELQTEIHNNVETLKTSIETLKETLSLRLTVRLGAMIAVGIGALAALLKLA